LIFPRFNPCSREDGSKFMELRRRPKCDTFRLMQLAMQSQKLVNVVVIRCQGRIVHGDETRALQQEIEKYAYGTKKFVLQMAGVEYVDSGGLGALVRLAATLRSGRGDLELCQISPFVQEVLEATTLLKVFRTFVSEQEAVDAFLEGPHSHGVASSGTGAKVFCIDTSLDVLSYLSALLKRSGYDVQTSHSLSDARVLLKATKHAVVVCGPGMHANEFALENLRHSAPGAQFLMLPSDFSTTHASHASSDLVDRLRALFNPPQS
jgi:anti-anti-sigma factor